MKEVFPWQRIEWNELFGRMLVKGLSFIKSLDKA